MTMDSDTIDPEELTHDELIERVTAVTPPDNPMQDMLEAAAHREEDES